MDELHPAIIAAVEEEIGDRIICDQCGATLHNVDAKCQAPDPVRCAGFEIIDEAVRRHAKRLNLKLPREAEHQC